MKSKQKKRLSSPSRQMEYFSDGSEEIVAEKIKDETLQKIKCLECHCVGAVMKTAEGLVLSPDTVKKTLLELDGGVFIPSLKKLEPSMKNAFQRAKDFKKGFNESGKNNQDDDIETGFIEKTGRRIQSIKERINRGIKNARDAKKMNIGKVIERENKKSAAPEKFKGLFSDEYQEERFWKSWKRFARQ